MNNGATRGFILVAPIAILTDITATINHIDRFIRVEIQASNTAYSAIFQRAVILLFGNGVMVFVFLCEHISANFIGGVVMGGITNFFHFKRSF